MMRDTECYQPSVLNTAFACFRLVRPEDCLIFSVQDSSLSRDNRPVIFSPVYQADQAKQGFSEG
jgi:hypothetical protein